MNTTYYIWELEGGEIVFRKRNGNYEQYVEGRGWCSNSMFKPEWAREVSEEEVRSRGILTIW